MPPEASNSNVAQFCRRAALFLTLGCGVLNLLGWLVVHTPLRIMLVGQEVWTQLARADGAAKANTLILGDSVAGQLYDANNEIATGYWHLATNQAISLAGQELLLRRALVHNPQIERVVLVLIPSAFGNDLDQPFTFNYFVKPFCDPFTWHQLSPVVRVRLARKWQLWAGLLPLVKGTQLFSEVDYSLDPSNSALHEEQDSARPASPRQPFLSAVSADALERMASLCRANGIRFELRSGPLSPAWADFESLRRSISAAKLSDLFSGYFESIRVLPAELFSDTVHLRKDVLPEYRNNWLGL
jgi:hypothetical protein